MCAVNILSMGIPASLATTRLYYLHASLDIIKYYNIYMPHIYICIYIYMQVSLGRPAAGDAVCMCVRRSYDTAT
jgi:hypothetical protein